MSRAHSYSHSRAHSQTFPSLYLHHNSFSNPSVDLPTSRLILLPFRCFTYVTVHSPTLLSLLLRHRVFTYVTRRAARGVLYKTSLVGRPSFINVKQLKYSRNIYIHFAGTHDTTLFYIPNKIKYVLRACSYVSYPVSSWLHCTTFCVNLRDCIKCTVLP